MLAINIIRENVEIYANVNCKHNSKNAKMPIANHQRHRKKYLPAATSDISVRYKDTRDKINCRA